MLEPLSVLLVLGTAAYWSLSSFQAVICSEALLTHCQSSNTFQQSSVKMKAEDRDIRAIS